MNISTTKLQNSFGKYLQLALDDVEIIITKNKQAVARLEKISESYIKEEAAKYDSDQLISYNAFTAMTEESEARYELIDGEIYLLASPSFEHQKVSMVFSEYFTAYFRDKLCKPFAAPLNITLVRQDVSDRSKKYKHVVQPDMMVLCDLDNVEDGRFLGVPELVIEILSPSTRSKDMIKKTDLYMNSGIREYWTADLKTKQILVYVFENYELEQVKSYHGNEIVKSELYPDLTIPLSSIFEF